eukprot:g14160.t1
MVKELRDTVSEDFQLSAEEGKRLPLNFLMVKAMHDRELLTSTRTGKRKTRDSCRPLGPRDRRILQRSAHYARFAAASYDGVMDTMKELADQGIFPPPDLFSNSTEYVRKWLVGKRAKIDPDDVKELATSDSLETRTFFVAVDHVSRSVVVSIRGTYSVSDTMVDLLCNPVDFAGGKAHQGISQSALRVWKAVKAQVEKQLREHEGYKLVLTGHSLGAGTAILLKILLARNGVGVLEGRINGKGEGGGALSERLDVGRPVRVECYAFAPPPVFSGVGAHWMPDVYSFVNGADCVPTMSLGSVYSLSRTLQKVDRLPLDVYKRAEFVLDSRVRVQQKEQGVEPGEVEHGRRKVALGILGLWKHPALGFLGLGGSSADNEPENTDEDVGIGSIWEEDEDAVEEEIEEEGEGQAVSTDDESHENGEHGGGGGGGGGGNDDDESGSGNIFAAGAEAAVRSTISRVGGEWTRFTQDVSEAAEGLLAAVNKASTSVGDAAGAVAEATSDMRSMSSEEVALTALLLKQLAAGGGPTPDQVMQLVQKCEREGVRPQKGKSRFSETMTVGDLIIPGNIYLLEGWDAEAAAQKGDGKDDKGRRGVGVRVGEGGTQLQKPCRRPAGAGSDLGIGAGTTAHERVVWATAMSSTASSSTTSVSDFSSWWDWIPDWLLDYNSFEETENVDFFSIGIVAGYTLGISFLLWLYWTYKRWDDPGFFSCKRAERPPDLPGPRQGPFAWIWALYRIPEEMLSVIALFALPVILPINLAGGFEDTDNILTRMSMSNVGIGSPWLWAHVAGIYVVTAVCLFFLKREFRAYIQVRQRYLQQRKPHMRTIMLDVPPDARSNAILESYFGYLYPDSVLSAVCTQDLHVLRGLLQKREAVLTKLERAELQRRASKEGEEPKVWTGACFGLGQRVDAVAYLTEELSYYNTEVSREQAKRLHHLRKIDQRALRMAAQGTLQQAIQAIMAQGGGQILDDEETGLVEQLLRRSDVARGSSDDEDDEGDEEATGVRRTSASPGGGARFRGVGQGRRGSGDDESGFPRRRTGSKSLERSLYGGGGMDMDDSDVEETTDIGYDDAKAGGRGLGALISTVMEGGGGGGGGAEAAESRPLLGRAQSSARVRRISFPEMTPRAFVTFKTFSAATVARQVLHGAAPGRMAAEESPEPRDIYWFNTRVTQMERKRRRIFVEGFLLVLYVFYVIPVTLLYLLLSEDSVTSYASWIKNLYDDSTIFAALVQMLQPMALLLLMNTLPPLIRLLGMLEGFPAESRNQLAVLSRYFYFQIINVFLVTTIANSILDTISQIVEEPTKTFTLLGEALPKVAGFFVEYIILKMFVGLWTELTRSISLLQEYVLRVIWPRKTPRDRAKVVLGIRPYFDAGWFNYPKYIAQDLLVVVVCLTYAIVNPFILVVGIPYFFACQLTYKHQMLFVYEPLYETGGVFFPKIFRRFIFALIIAQATMVGILILKLAYYQAGLVLVLMVLTYFAKSSLRGSYEPAALSLPLEIAKVLDDVEPARRPARDHDDGEDTDARTAYLQPSLKAEPFARPELDRDHQANIDFERFRGRV